MSMLQTLKSVQRNKAQGGVSRWALYHLLHTLQSHCNLLLSTSFFLLLRHLHLCHAVRACRKLTVTLIIPFMMSFGTFKFHTSAYTYLLYNGSGSGSVP